ncbi:hypothetical protein POVWA1_002480 [Plasmodium ovale wallikeri]|uniref:Uncharacterized protein n=1 Tax=Plasmodium ovale wallikeri TaxID=864142 RepID=A0A1A8YGB1_PLAOA|nr:hypothetical protein POVWA1_002480 [Plasmodium ovale wallikeri]
MYHCKQTVQQTVQQTLQQTLQTITLPLPFASSMYTPTYYHLTPYPPSGDDDGEFATSKTGCPKGEESINYTQILK